MNFLMQFTRTFVFFLIFWHFVVIYSFPIAGSAFNWQLAFFFSFFLNLNHTINVVNFQKYFWKYVIPGI